MSLITACMQARVIGAAIVNILGRGLRLNCHRKRELPYYHRSFGFILTSTVTMSRYSSPLAQRHTCLVDGK